MYTYEMNKLAREEPRVRLRKPHFDQSIEARQQKE